MSANKELLDEFAELCFAQGYGASDFCNSQSKKDRKRKAELYAKLLRELTEDGT